VLSELYKSGKIRKEALGVLANTIICIKTGCLASGPEAVFGNTVIQLAETITLAPQRRAAQKEAKQTKPATTRKQTQLTQSKQTQKQEATQQPARVEKPAQQQVTQKEEDRTSYDMLVALLANEAKVDKTKAEAVFEAITNYLAVYPSTGVIRLIEDVSRISKAEPRVVRTALEILRSADVVELREEGVVNLKKLVKRGGIPL